MYMAMYVCGEVIFAEWDTSYDAVYVPIHLPLRNAENGEFLSEK